MDSHGSVTHWIHQLKDGDELAYQKLWEGYFQRLVVLARQKLTLISRGAADEEDVALSAFDAFYSGVASNRFPQLLDRDDLWQVLVLLTVRKAANLFKHERRQTRGGGKVRHASTLGDDEGEAFANLIGREPDPGFAAQVVEQCRQLLDLLGDTELRAVALWKMEGYTNAEIAAKQGRSEATVERKLRLIRDTWKTESGHEW